jgi:DNA-binding NarL/FixJ family response regulator
MYLARSVEELHQIVLHGMTEMVRGETYDLVLCGTPSRETDLYLTKPDTFTNDEKSFALAHADDHPIVRAWAAGASGVLSVSMCSSARAWQATALFQDGGYRRQGLRQEVAVQLPGVSREGLAVFSIARGNPDFSGSDLEMLSWMRPHIARAWTEVQRRISGLSPVTLRHRFPVLSAREAEVLFWMIEGKQNAEIAAILERRLNTIQEHVENIIRKLGMENRHQMTVAVLRTCLG